VSYGVQHGTGPHAPRLDAVTQHVEWRAVLDRSRRQQSQEPGAPETACVRRSDRITLELVSERNEAADRSFHEVNKAETRVGSYPPTMTSQETA